MLGIAGLSRLPDAAGCRVIEIAWWSDCRVIEIAGLSRFPDARDCRMIEIAGLSRFPDDWDCRITGTGLLEF
jgi:hypothetical protein